MNKFQEETVDRGKSEGGFLHLSPDAEKEAKSSFVLISAAHETYAIEIAKVREIIRMPQITWVPGARPPVKGLTNLRGSIVTVLDLADILSGASTDPDEGARVVVVDAARITVGLLVQSASSVEEIPDSSLQPPMITLKASQRQFLAAQTNINNRLVGILDLDSLVIQARQMQPNI